VRTEAEQPRTAGKSGASAATEDYLRAIYRLAEDQGAERPGSVMAKALAERLGVSQAAITGMAKRLAAAGLVEHTPYQGLALTAEGRRQALRLVRRHRILECYLVARLDYRWDEVDAEVEVLEHTVSHTLVERMWQALGCPTVDPHGAPIPADEGDLAAVVDRGLCLADASPGRRYRVQRVRDCSAETLRFLAQAGLTPGVELEVRQAAAVPGQALLVAILSPAFADMRERVVALGTAVAHAISVTASRPS